MLVRIGPGCSALTRTVPSSSFVMEHAHQAAARAWPRHTPQNAPRDPRQVVERRTPPRYRRLRQQWQASLGQQPRRGEVDVQSRTKSAGGVPPAASGRELGGAMQDAVSPPSSASMVSAMALVIGRVGACQVERIQRRLRAHAFHRVIGATELRHLAAEQHHGRAGPRAGLAAACRGRRRRPSPGSPGRASPGAASTCRPLAPARSCRLLRFGHHAREFTASRTVPR